MNNMQSDPLSSSKKPTDPNPLAGDSFEALRNHMPTNRPPMHYESATDGSRVEEMKKKLYSKSISGIDNVKRPSLHEHSQNVAESWNHAEPTMPEPLPKIDRVGQVRHHNSFMKRVLVFAILFFLGAVGYAVYVTVNGTNVVSSENIDMNIIAPVSIASAEPLTVDVEITNRNRSEIVSSVLVVTYPDGTRNIDNTPVINYRYPLGDGTIKPGQIVKQRMQVVLFAEEGTKKNIKVSLEYHIPDSTSVFTKQKDLPILIGNSPISLTIDTVSQIAVGQDVVMELDIKSNSTQIIKNTLLKASFPFGFKFKSATPNPSAGIDTWFLGDIAPNSERRIKIVGSMLGNENQDRVFKFNVGTIDPKDETRIGSVFVTANTELAVTKPFIGSDIILNDQSDLSVAVPAGEIIQGEITWQNNVEVPINDVVIEAKLTGGFLDRTSVRSDPGFFRSSDNVIVWDKSNLSGLREIRPGETGRVVFRFSSQQPSVSNFGTVRSPAITVDLTIRGTRLNENNVPQEVKSIVTKVAKVQSEIELKTRLVRNIGPFVNTGPFPTVAEKVSTFTVFAGVSNSYNTVKGVVYKTELPNYVKWLGQTNPASAQVSYDSLTRIITWNVGDVPAGTGYSSPVKEMAYQVAFEPSLSQVNTTPIITKDQTLSGTDSFVGKVMNSSDVPLNIKISTDPGYKFGQDYVLAP